MFSNRRLERLAGALLVAGFAAFLGHLVVLVTLRALSPTILLVLAYGLLMLLSAVALYLAFRPHEEALALFSASGLAAHGLFVVLACALILAHTEFAQKFSATSQTDAVAAPAAALELAMNKIRSSAFAFLGVGFFPLGALVLRGGAIARWVGWLGIVSGLLGFLGSLAGLFEAFGAGNRVMLASIVPSFGFMLVIGIQLLLRQPRAATV